MGYVSVEGDPHEVAVAAAALIGSGEALRAALSGPQAQIAAIEGEAPWGADQFGDRFLESYTDDKSGAPFNTAVRDITGDLPGRIDTLGEGATWAVAGFQAADSEIAADINSL